MKIEVNKPCIVCGSSESTLLFENRYPEHGYPGIFAIRRCEQCDLLFNSPQLQEEQVSALYGKNYYLFLQNDRDEFLRIVDVYRRTVAMAAGYTAQKKVLEIGSAKGYLLALLKRLGWEVQAVEISPDAARYGIDHFDAPTFVGTVEEYAKATEHHPFPLVLAIDVLEHIPDPVNFLISTNGIVQTNGILVIDTPNGAAHNISIDGPQWIGFNPFHIYLFSKENIMALLDKSGYRVETIFSYGNKTSVGPGSSRIKRVLQPRNLIKRIFPRTQALNLARVVYQKSRIAFAGRENEESLIENAVRALESTPSYAETEDTRLELSEGCRGDNLVIIARKAPMR